MKFEVRVFEPTPNIFCFLFPNQYLVTSSFARIQEFAEGTFGKNYFSLEMFLDLCYESNKSISYFSDWSGFNLYSNDIKEFYNIFYKKNKDLTLKEENIYYIIHKYILPKIEDEFYIIGIHKKSDMDHEISHGFYSMSEEYRENMNSNISKLKNYKSIKNWIVSLGYCGQNEYLVFNEIQAYLATSSKKYLSQMGYKFMWGKQDIFKKYYRKFKNEWKNRNENTLLMDEIYFVK